MCLYPEHALQPVLNTKYRLALRALVRGAEVQRSELARQELQARDLMMHMSGASVRQ